MVQKKLKEVQLSLFETQPEPSVLEFIKARFENGPEMSEEEYKRWIRILVEKCFNK